MNIELVNPKKTMLDEINDTSFKQKHIARTYGMLIKQELISQSVEVDWSKINKAIIDRWSFSGLEKIKRIAYKNIGL